MLPRKYPNPITATSILGLGFSLNLLLLLLYGITPRVSGQGGCVMYGICGRSANNKSFLPCNVSHPPIELPSTERLSRFCPELISTNGSELCCDENQVEQLIKGLYAPESLIGKCPPCFHNFRQSICDLVCSPLQSKWLHVISTQQNPENETEHMVTEVNMYISSDYVGNVYGSCQDVQLICTGVSAMSHLCGPGYDQFGCSAVKWFDWIGNPANGLTPFKINYKFDLEGQLDKELYSAETIKCSESVNGFPNGTCNLEDCPTAGWSSTTVPPMPTDPGTSTSEPITDSTTQGYGGAGVVSPSFPRIFLLVALCAILMSGSSKRNI